MTKSLLLIGTLALAGIASAKSYEIALSTPATVDGLRIAAGNYEVKVVGKYAVFTNTDNGYKAISPVKVKDAGAKFEQTAVESQIEDGAKTVRNVELGGTSTVIELGE